MIDNPTLEDVERWLKHPKVHKVTLAKALASGHLLNIFNDKETPEDLKKRLMEQLPSTFKSLDTSILLRSYGAIAGTKSKRIKIHAQAFNKEFIRQRPSKRMSVLC